MVYSYMISLRLPPFELIGKSDEGSHSGEIDHTGFLSGGIGSLFMDPLFSDVIFVVNGEKFPAHKVILAARSEYFRALLYGGMKESEEGEIVLEETNAFAFRMLLRYIYTAKLALPEYKEEQVMEILGLAHKYGIVKLQDAVSDYLKTVLNSSNLCAIFSISQLYSLNDLTECCLVFADRNATEVLTSQGFLQSPLYVVIQLVERDSFCASEIDIFCAMREWLKIRPEMEGTAVETLLKCLRLSFISQRDLLNIVHPTGLFAHDVILDAIEEQDKKCTTALTHRGILNGVASGGGGLAFINDKGIVVQLGHPYIINKITLMLWDDGSGWPMYSYYVEVSVDRCDWVRIVDHSRCLCRSRQYLFFESRVVKYIRIVGTYNSHTSDRLFLKDMEASHCSDQFSIDPKTTLLIPTANVATIENNALVVKGESRCRNAILIGNNADFDCYLGYTYHWSNCGAIVIHLPQPYMIGTMRLLLWDRDDRYYSYYVEVSTDRENWTTVIDRRDKQCRGWQLLELAAPVPVVFVKIVGTYSSANDGIFRCVYFECPADPQAPPPDSRSVLPYVISSGW